MEEQFHTVQKSFMDLSLFLSSLDLRVDLQDQATLEKLNRELGNTYSIFEEGLCVNVPLCQMCYTNQKKLKNVVDIIAECADNKSMTDEAYGVLHEYLEVIPQVLNEVKVSYLQSLSQTS